jgi:lysophospholipase L1-like esterase
MIWRVGLESVNRREFLLASVVLAGAACRSASGENITSPEQTYTLPDGARILFQGDSITDAGHDSGTLDPNVPSALGYGYPLFIAQHLLLARPKQALKVYNRARGGDTVPLLQARWQTDAINLQPDLLTILIGLNDFVADYTKPNYAAIYEQNYTALVDQTRQALPNTQLVIVEPYAIHDPPVPEFDSIRAAAARVAAHANAIWVPLHDILNQYVSEETHEYWFNDQHPTIAGSAAIAEQWLNKVGL